ncbi:putative signal transduction protein [Escherichia coli]|uniref:Putative signal transduction protein n=1 Tax=Escherichia coli TaxID=562 RepID=A0A447XEJ8_ECOLX|nr:putative signal transduction protein [Escherichia coli]
MALSSNTITLAVLLSLLVGYIAWLATAYRMSFSREINLGLAQHEFELVLSAFA